MAADVAQLDMVSATCSRRIAGWTIRSRAGAGGSCSRCRTVVVWAVTGPFFHYSENWQLVINTGTTIVTFLMVFLIQNAQNRESKAIHLKLDELILSVRKAAERADRHRAPDRGAARLHRRALQEGGRGHPARAGSTCIDPPGGTSLARRASRTGQVEASHDGEVIARREIEVLGLQLQGEVVVDAVVAHLEQEVAGLAAAEGAVAPAGSGGRSGSRSDLGSTSVEAELGGEDVEHLAEHRLGRVGRVDLVGNSAEERLVDELLRFEVRREEDELVERHADLLAVGAGRGSRSASRAGRSSDSAARSGPSAGGRSRRSGRCRCCSSSAAALR